MPSGQWDSNHNVMDTWTHLKSVCGFNSGCPIPGISPAHDDNDNDYNNANDTGSRNDTLVITSYIARWRHYIFITLMAVSHP